MPRRHHLRVLYWPTLASAAIVVLLLGHARVGQVIEPGIAAPAEAPTLAASPTLVSGPPTLPASPTPRCEPRKSLARLPDRHVAQRAAMLSETPLAAAALRAPQRRIEEELAGLAWDSESPSASQLRFAGARHGSDDYQPMNCQVGHQAYIGDELWDASAGMTMVNRSRHGLGGGWPETPELRRQVAVSGSSQSATFLVNHPTPSRDLIDLQGWQQEVSDELDRLQQLRSIAAAESADVLGRLALLAQRGYEAAELVEDRQSQIACLCAAHALQRRVAIWTAAHRATSAVASWAGDQGDPWSVRQRIEGLIQQVAHDVAASDDVEGWRRYLLLDELAQANQSESEPQRRIVAQRFLSRLSWYGLSETQRVWMERESVDALEAAVRRWAVTPVDYASLLGQLERQESDAIDLGGIDVAQAAQSLRFATSPEAAQLAAMINAHYRNANIRLAVTETLINRLVPEVDARIDPVRQRILGADVRGHSHVDSRLAVRLIPSASTWRLQLETLGTVRADTVGRSGPVSIRTGSHADFLSATPLEFTRASAAVGGTQVSVDSTTRLRGVASEFDSVPLIGSLVREIALNRYQSLAPRAKQIQHGQISDRVSTEIDQRVTEQLQDASDAVTRHLLGPLGSLGLSPMVVDMQTTPERLTARYRVGGDWQLAAFTPRPRAPADSLMSLQIHQSAFNNTLEKVLPAGQTKTIQEISSHLKSLFSIPEDFLSGDDDHHDPGDDTIIQFAATRPITIEIEDDLLWVTLRVMRLSREGAIDLRRFIVRAAYRCEVDALSASLVRDGHLRISGPGMSMRDRLPVRAIFNKVFSTHRPLPITPARMIDQPAMDGLMITQLELRDGWLGLAIGPATEPRTAKKQ